MKWDEALEIEPQNSLLHELRAQILLELGEDDMALEAAQQATQFSPDWADAHLTLGRVFVNNGLLQEAKISMEHALELAKRGSNPFQMQENEMSSTLQIETDLEEVLRLITLKEQMEEAKNATAQQSTASTGDQAPEE